MDRCHALPLAAQANVPLGHGSPDGARCLGWISSGSVRPPLQSSPPLPPAAPAALGWAQLPLLGRPVREADAVPAAHLPAVRPARRLAAGRRLGLGAGRRLACLDAMASDPENGPLR